jgi:hypothetical protein
MVNRNLSNLNYGGTLSVDRNSRYDLTNVIYPVGGWLNHKFHFKIKISRISIVSLGGYTLAPIFFRKKKKLQKGQFQIFWAFQRFSIWKDLV